MERAQRAQAGQQLRKQAGQLGEEVLVVGRGEGDVRGAV